MKKIGGEIGTNMSKRGRKKEKIGRSVLARCVVICTVAAIISSLAIPVPALAALQAEDPVTITVNAPDYVEETFNVTIDVANITDFNSGQFDLSFNSSVVNVTDVKDGEINGEAVPIFMWSFMDADTVRVLVGMPMGVDVSGSGCLAEVEFEVKGRSGDKSNLNISNGLLVDIEAKEIEAVWDGAEVRIGGEEEEPAPTPTIAPEETPLEEATPAVKPTATPTTDGKPKPKPSGFEAILAIAVMSGIAYTLLRKR